MHTAGITHRDVKLENVFVAARCWGSGNNPNTAGVACASCAATARLHPVDTDHASDDIDDEKRDRKDAPLPFCAASARLGDFGCVRAM